MNRRNFMTACAAAAGGAALLKNKGAFAEIPPGKPFAKAKLRMSAPISFFPGETHVDKLDAVAAWGLPAYEWLGPSGDLDALRAKADDLGLVLSCLAGAGAIRAGQMVQPDDHKKVIDQFKKSVKVAQKLNCTHIIGLSGNERKDVSREKQAEYVVKCIKRLAPIAEDNGVFLVMEALNTLVNHRGYFLDTTALTMDILKEVDSPNVKMCFDIYHQQITEGNVIRNLTKNIDRIGHFHVADNPGRKEPGTGEMNYTNIFKAIEGTNYKDFVALECGHSTKNYEDTLKATLACLNRA